MDVRASSTLLCMVFFGFVAGDVYAMNDPTITRAQRLGIQKPIKPSTTTTTTTTTTISNPIDVAKEEPDVEMVRLCTCTETDECIGQAYANKLSGCQASCKTHLKFFGHDIDNHLNCFKNDKNDANLMGTCLKKNIKDFCAVGPSDGSPVFNEKPDYDFQHDDAKKIKIKELPIVEAFKAFHVCAGQCVKKEIIQCFDTKQCGVTVTSKNNFDNIADFCPQLKISVTNQSVKALPCLNSKPKAAKIH